MRVFTWRDIQTEIDQDQINWPKSWLKVHVYSDEVIIYVKKEIDNKEQNDIYLRSLFSSSFDKENQTIRLTFLDKKMDVGYEDGDIDDKINLTPAPLFKEMYINRDKEMFAELSDLPGVPIKAFHSYKGGVGRTLSMIALIREITTAYKGKKRLLIIDSDLEAPGLTWMINESRSNLPISYLDILSIVHSEGYEESVIDKISKLVEISTITIETEVVNANHYFIPVYREESQLMDIYSSPEIVLLTETNKYMLAEMVSMIGEKVGADLVLVDLRAGISEFSAPYLFDPRVSKFYVTSTSLQSVKGTKLILDRIYNNTPSDIFNSKIILTMVPLEMNLETKSRIIDDLVEPFEKSIDSEDATFLRSEYIMEFDFYSELIHLGNLQQVCDLLRNKTIMSQLALTIFGGTDVLVELLGEEQLEEEEVRETLKRLNHITSDEITAEGSDSTNMLLTSSIQQIIKDHRFDLPKIVVLGAKGSGKTYIYRQLASKKTWKTFVESVEGNADNINKEIYILPLLSTESRKKLKENLVECIDNVNTNIAGLNVPKNVYSHNFDTIRGKLDKSISLNDWKNSWIDIIINSLGIEAKSLNDVDEYLNKQNKKIIFIIDGLEDLFKSYKGNDSWKEALASVCKDIINEINDLVFGNIGIIVFVRKDMAEDAISTNYEQFRGQYIRYALNWSQTEALRLALWMAMKANPIAFEISTDIINTPKEVMEEKLSLLWGKKLGKDDSKEASSSRWIIAALSDFNGQLQARDIIRFLKFATDKYAVTKRQYKDRYIMPSEIREAIEPCSKLKLSEIKDEIEYIYLILEKFRKLDAKVLPISLEKMDLTGYEISKLEGQGYLKVSDKQYYLPEIIRLAFGFKYGKGARPKVLSLLVQ